MSSSLEGLHQPHASGKAANASADPNIDTFLVASVDQGHLYYFLDGSYPLGAVSLRSESDLSLSLPPNPSQPMFLAHLRVRTDTGILTDLLPTAIELPLLAKRHVRDMARLSSTARELVWYIMRVVKEMRVTWFGSETVGGARELGPKWVRLLETRQKEKFGRRCYPCSPPIPAVTTLRRKEHEPHPVLDLTALLLTGRASETLADFLGSGEQMSERVNTP
jgi:anaphase-promoting complex subunit 4